MATLTLNSKEYDSFPAVLRDYASYTAAIKGNSEKTVCEYLLDLRTFFRFLKAKKSGRQPDRSEFEKISISDLTLADVDAVTTENVISFLMFAGFERENSPTTRMRKLSSLKSFFHYMHGKKHLIDHNPTSEVDPPKKSKSLPKYLTVEESLKLLGAVEEDVESKTRVRDFTIITLFLNTGMRLSELVGLNLQSFAPDLSNVRVLGKGNKERMIYLNRAAKEALATYLRTRLDPKFIRTSDTAFFLSRRQQRISAKTVQWVVYKYLNLAGLGAKGLSVHKLRHTAATLMYQSGKVDIRVLKDILGHEQLNTTQIYTHVVSRDLEKAMEYNPLSDITTKNIAKKGQ